MFYNETESRGLFVGAAAGECINNLAMLFARIKSQLAEQKAWLKC
jgi:hypothetical protein